MIDRAQYRELSVLFDAEWYWKENPDVRRTGLDPLEHYLEHGWREGRAPCPYFDSGWYLRHYPDVARTGILPFLHYLRHGAAELRRPHPRFDAEFYVDAHPEAWGNPLLFHHLVGEALGLPTERPLDITDYLPLATAPRSKPANAAVDIIIPVYRGLAETRRCIESVLADPDRPAGRILVIDDCSPERRLSAWLGELAKGEQITLVRNTANLGFVGTINRGIAMAGRNDVVLLNADTEVPPGWLGRLQTAAYATPDIASVSPFSNNATICSYPSTTGGGLPPGHDLHALDSACRIANAGRAVELPTTVGFCMYIRRKALDAVGPFDADTFGKGYGEEVDFCQRARAKGWRNLLACDVFVYHQGEVSFGAGSRQAQAAQAILRERYPLYEEEVARFSRLDPATPARFASTVALIRSSGLPSVLMLGHGLGGGVDRQMREITEGLAGKAHVLVLNPTASGVALSVPGLPGHPALHLAPDREADLTALLRAADVRRAHVHHTMGNTMDLRALLDALGIPFDVTVHDYYALCPHVNFLPFLDAQYCGEPDARHCNACLSARPEPGAPDIDTWRLTKNWLFTTADRVICPSNDARERLARHGLAERAIVVPHEARTATPWRVTAPPLGRRKLRIALLGVLADRKGRAIVESVAEQAGDDVALHLIGYPEHPIAPAAAARLTVTGEYAEADLPGMIAALKPHAIWFPAQWPETYSYTLTAAIDAGVPILATRIGAFPERLAGRPLTWQLPANATAADWVAAFGALRAALSATSIKSTGRAPRPAAEQDVAAAPRSDFYVTDYAAPLTRQRPKSAPAKATRPRVLVIPEHLANGTMSPCAYIRLLQPLARADINGGCDLRLGDIGTARAWRADIVVTQRHAIRSLADATALTSLCHANRSHLIYDLDDDLLHIPRNHPEAAQLSPLAEIVAHLAQGADTVWASTPRLAARMGKTRARPVVIRNALDDRLWWPPATVPPRDETRLLVMGTATHMTDLRMITPALHRLHETFGRRIAIEVIGTTPDALPGWMRRIDVPQNVLTYPAFVDWLSRQGRWDIGLAPLQDTPFNRAKSAIKAMDYAGLGLPTVASDIGVYTGTIADGDTGLLVANTDAAWFAAIAMLVRDPARRARMAASAHTMFTERFSLSSQAADRRKALLDKLPRQAMA